MKPSKLLAFILVVVAILASPLKSQQTAEDRLTKLAEDYLQAQFDFDPVTASEMGEHRLDGVYPDFSSAAVNRFVNKLRQIKGNVKKIKSADLSTDARIDQLLLESNIDSRITYLTNTILYRDNPKLISSTAINGIYFLMISQSLTPDERIKRILERVSRLPEFLTKSQKQIKNPPQIWSILAKEEAENAANLLGEVSAHFASQFPELQSEIDVKFTAATVALQEFSDFLNDFAEREGQSFAIGREIFNRLLTTEYFLNYDTDSLLRIGETLLEQAQVAYDSLSAIVDTLPPISELNVFIPESFTRADILDYFQWEIDQTRNWVSDHDFATVPDDIGKCIPVETPRFLENIIGGIAYLPAGPFDTVQTARFYVRPLPDSLDDANRSAFFRYCYRRGFRSSVVHEAYPGHHLELQLANRNTSLIRRIQRNNLMVEGWALYCEEAMYREGFYGNDLRQQLAIAGGIRFRAARIIVDVKLQTGQMTYQQAVDWMVEKLGSSLEYIEKEVSRYSLSPTIPMTYLIGKGQIELLKQSFQDRLGEEYSTEKFHDLLLNEGPIPPMLIYRKVNDQIL